MSAAAAGDSSGAANVAARAAAGEGGGCAKEALTSSKLSPSNLSCCGGAIPGLHHAPSRNMSFYRAMEPTLEAVQEGEALEMGASSIHGNLTRTNTFASDSDVPTFASGGSAIAARLTPEGRGMGSGSGQWSPRASVATPDVQVSAQMRSLMEQIHAIGQMTDEDLMDPLRSSRLAGAMAGGSMHGGGQASRLSAALAPHAAHAPSGLSNASDVYGSSAFYRVGSGSVGGEDSLMLGHSTSNSFSMARRSQPLVGAGCFPDRVTNDLSGWGRPEKNRPHQGQHPMQQSSASGPGEGMGGFLDQVASALQSGHYGSMEAGSSAFRSPSGRASGSIGQLDSMQQAMSMNDGYPGGGRLRGQRSYRRSVEMLDDEFNFKDEPPMAGVMGALGVGLVRDAAARDRLPPPAPQRTISTESLLRKQALLRQQLQTSAGEINAAMLQQQQPPAPLQEQQEPWAHIMYSGDSSSSRGLQPAATRRAGDKRGVRADSLNDTSMPSMSRQSPRRRAGVEVSDPPPLPPAPVHVPLGGIAAPLGPPGQLFLQDASGRLTAVGPNMLPVPQMPPYHHLGPEGWGRPALPQQPVAGFGGQQPATWVRSWSVTEILLVSAGAVMILINFMVVVYVVMLRFLMSEMRGWLDMKEEL